MGYCIWADMNEANRSYHDTEWGIPVHDDTTTGLLHLLMRM